MNKLSLDPITSSDINKYLENFSDFRFELQVLQQFLKNGFICSHSGTYEDPVTRKSREYDIRALFQKDSFRIHLSIECKNLKENFPLIVHCLKRKDSENYNELISTFIPKAPSQKVGPISLPLPSAFMENSRSIRLTKNSIYPLGNFVGKSVDQIGKRHDNSEIIANDGEVFDKISQAINSSIDLIAEAPFLDTDIFPTFYTFVCPVLVIPDLSLWQINYSEDGEKIGEPERINHISYYIGKDWTVSSGLQKLTYTLSHLEIITYSEIGNFTNKYLGNYLSICANIFADN